MRAAAPSYFSLLADVIIFLQEISAANIFSKFQQSYCKKSLARK